MSAGLATKPAIGARHSALPFAYISRSVVPASAANRESVPALHERHRPAPDRDRHWIRSPHGVAAESPFTRIEKPFNASSTARDPASIPGHLFDNARERIIALK